MNTQSNPSEDFPNQGYSNRQSSGAITELAKYYYNTQIRDAPSSGKLTNTSSSDSVLHEPIDALEDRDWEKKRRRASNEFSNKHVYEGALEDKLEGCDMWIDRMEEEEMARGEKSGRSWRATIKSDMQERLSKRERSSSSRFDPDKPEEPDELELIEKRVWGISTSIPPAQEFGPQNIIRENNSRQTRSSMAGRAGA
ncbi:hypothetical protein L873DRAFT_1788847 [Choiromyces venosus 120613-1]|uniref:Uncharacterized protein n=1 Tax=Choiromyces venosus 120613-1 TaxID=1336337 RepID=A0A3N4JQQ1_9PEZI|nr:hypothetical protein L873DRAFT_1788847 [Choiromyces venosus 120613-1]